MRSRPTRELSRREFLAVAGAAAALPLIDRVPSFAREPKRIRIRSVGLDFEREPNLRPLILDQVTGTVVS